MPDVLRAVSRVPRWYLLRAKLRLHGVRFGERVRGNRVIIRNKGTITLGDDVRLNSYPDGELHRTGLQTFTDSARITIGNDCLVNGTMMFCNEAITVGDHCLFGPGAKLVDNDSHRVGREWRVRKLPPASAAIVLHNNVWIGMNALVLKGVAIGENSIVAAGSVVTKNVPPNVIVAGVPARVVKVLADGSDRG